MLLVDDLLAAPVKGVFWIVKTVHGAAIEQLEAQQRESRDELSDLYMQLDTGRISEQEFEAREKVLLDQLESEKQALGQADGGQVAEGPETKTEEANKP